MRVGVDARALTPPITGTGVYLRELLRQLVQLRPELELVLYTTRPLAPSTASPNARAHVGRGLSARWGTLWLQTALPALARRDELDLFWGPLQVLPVRLIGRMPTVVTVHDLVFQRYPETMSWRNRIALPYLARRSIRGADRVIAVSETTARDATRELALDPERMTIVRNAVDEDLAPVERATARRLVRERFGVGQEGRDYLLFVGTLEPRKNLEGLLEALTLLAASEEWDGEALIVGGAGWKSGPLRRKIQDHPLGSRLRLAGYVEHELLPSLYSAARLFVMPSIYEGFGLPVLEAMSCGAPVVCSDRDPFPEVAGSAAVLAPPDDPVAFSEAIARVWRSDQLRAEMRTKGLEHAAGFRWQDSARTLLEVFDQLKPS